MDTKAELLLVVAILFVVGVNSEIQNELDDEMETADEMELDEQKLEGETEDNSDDPIEINNSDVEKLIRQLRRSLQHHPARRMQKKVNTKAVQPRTPNCRRWNLCWLGLRLEFVKSNILSQV